MLDELYMQSLADAMRVPAEPLPTGKVTVSGPQVEAEPKQPEMGTITGIPQTAFEKALETSGIKLSELGDMIDQSAPGTLNTLLGRDIPIIGNLKLRDFLPFVGSQDDGKLTGTPAALIAAGTGQPLRGQPVVGSSIGPDGQRYYGTSGSPAMLSEDVGTAVVDVATLGLGKPLAAGAKKAVKATKNMPVGMSTKAVGQGVDELGFYSAAKQAVDAIQQPKGTGQQFLKQIEKTPGVKPDEIKWTGLDEFLQSKKSVTKAEVQEYLDKNRVEIKEITLGSSANPYPYRTADEWQGAIDRAERAKDFDEAERLTNAWEMFEGVGMSDQTKFSKYTLPGGENYREVLLTLPSKSQFDPEKVEIARNRQSLTQGSYTIKYDNKEVGTFSDDLKVSDNYKGYSDEQIMNHAKSLYEKGSPYSGIKPISTDFKSQHFDQPNILAHLRVNDRVIDGKKTLFVEEVQSDWHQAGRKKGYAQDVEKQLAKINEERAALVAEKSKVLDEAAPFTDKGMDAPQALLDRFTKADDRLAALQTQQNRLGQGVPDAPFKTTWSDLSMKRAIQMASEGGYERIAFTTGKTQAERFDLSKQISEVHLSGTDLVAYDKNGDTVIKQTGVTKDNLADYIGKEPAQKLLDQKPQGTLRSISGVDLQVGGEGMKGFYDDILPKFLDKYAKKWDAKAGMTNIITNDEIEIIKANAAKAFGKDSDAYKQAVKNAMEEVHYIDITPKMRESVMTKGQPMFAIGAGGAGAAATQEENK